MNQFTASLWGDEAFSAILSQKSIPQIIAIIARDTSPPLYNICEHLLFRFFGSSEIAIRALSFAFFILAIFFVYKIGENLWSRKTGAIAAILTFFNPFFFTYAFEGRMYSLLALTVTSSFYFFLSRRWKLYVLTTAAALYTHHFAVFAILPQGLWFLKEYFFCKKKVAIQILKSFIAIAILYLPWVMPLLNQAKMVGTGFWLGTPTLTDFRSLVYKYLAEGIPHKLAQPALYLVLAAFVIKRWGKDVEKNLFLVFWFLVPIIAVWVISQKYQAIFFDRYMLYTIPAAMLLIASGLRKISLPILAGVIALFIIIDSFYFTHPTKRPFRELAAYVTESKRGDDYLINWNSAAHHLWESKYYGIPAPIYLSGDKLPYYVGTALMTEADTVSSLPQGKNARSINRIGVITSGPVEEVKLPGYTKNEVKQFGSLKFLWYLRIR
ncbi:MAG TPA: glycosyltransferase family 39 protein [Patescibacteria group bacterium]|uniref:Glycosyltransferase RgtA/B/C/D-like domain-containing protein n=1 Tax=Candidatus Woesebacteria bacterium RBG_13_46_13 TaxID=1802479 RepID=A0A1F7X522_9BACT|nr:MAG: hypothetical protein A2Y68_02055 [Candidatus Woesebacteria bacterium RBG_13_46_13]HJX59366.1 glycosyltransferase family 39 protein [Patescibacteria group bacterium]